MEGNVGLQSGSETASPEIVFGKKPVLKVPCKSVTTVSAGANSQISSCPKGSNARIRPISDKLLQMLLALPSHQQQTKRVFPYKTVDFAGKTFRLQRKRAVVKLGNPELRKIDFYTFRYWRATYEYSRLNSEGAVMVLLGHKSLKYIFLYVQLSHIYFNGGNREYICKEAFTRQQEMQYIEQGYDYVRTDKNGVSLYRKLKE